jgi:hypothetical protein
MLKPFTICYFLAMFIGFSGVCQDNGRTKPVALIFDTDIGPDYDDVGAITMLHALADSGQVDILATIASDKYARVS